MTEAWPLEWLIENPFIDLLNYTMKICANHVPFPDIMKNKMEEKICI